MCKTNRDRAATELLTKLQNSYKLSETIRIGKLFESVDFKLIQRLMAENRPRVFSEALGSNHCEPERVENHQIGNRITK